MDFEFTDDQLEGYKQILHFILGYQKGMFLLQGYAGTGKTFLVTQIIKELSVEFKHKIGVTAPTHKALKALKKILNEELLNVTFATIHSALGLKEVVDGFGKIKFTRDRFAKQPLIDKINVLIVDEVSMLDDDLFYHLDEILKSKNIKIIFVGDPAQIPPINKLSCIPFNKLERKKRDINSITLSKIVRQTENNPIIKLTQQIRNNIIYPDLQINRESKITEAGEITFLKKQNNNDQDKLIEILDKHFSSPSFQEEPDFMKVIAWQNATVNGYNALIRNMIFGPDIPKLMIGEKLIFDQPYLENNNVLFNNNDEITVLNYKIVEGKFQDFGKVKVYFADVEKIMLTGKRLIKTIKILHEDSQPKFDAVCEEFKKKAKKEKQGTFQAVQAWKHFYALKENFAAIKYNYCITAHKSQGSTYENCIVLENDIFQNNNVVERNRIFYTACSRPSKNLWIIY